MFNCVYDKSTLQLLPAIDLATDVLTGLPEKLRAGVQIKPAAATVPLAAQGSADLRRITIVVAEAPGIGLSLGLDVAHRDQENYEGKEHHVSGLERHG